MPTGYTSDVQDGTITEFRVFAMKCARAMGATVTMRDEPHSAEIPEVFIPSAYYAEKIESIQAEIDRQVALTDEEREAEYKAECKRIAESEMFRRGERSLYRERYEAMLEKVRSWNIPSPEHAGLKEFMVEQLTSSIEWDCKNYPSEPPKKETKSEALSRLLEDLNRAKKDYAEDIERVASRNKWLRELRESLRQ